MSSFAAGLIIGQLSVVLVAALVVRFFLFSDGQATRGVAPPAPKVQPAVPDTLSSILEHTYYNVETHKPESMDWLTLLLALNLSAVRRDAVKQDRLLKLINSQLKGGLVPQFVGDVHLTELDLGKDYPLLHNCTVVANDDREFSDGLEAQFDFDLKDKITIGFETRLMLNYPRPMVASLPIRASLSLVHLSGRVSLSVLAEEQHAITIQFAPDFQLEFEVHSLIGARSQLCDVPKLAQLVESALRSAFAQHCVAPNFVKLPIPYPWDMSSTTTGVVEEKIVEKQKASGERTETIVKEKSIVTSEESND